jgi:hypothetical protein
VRLEGVKRELGMRLVPLSNAPSVDTVRVGGMSLSEIEGLEITPGADPGWTRDRDGTVRVMCRLERGV